MPRAPHVRQQMGNNKLQIRNAQTVPCVCIITAVLPSHVCVIWLQYSPANPVTHKAWYALYSPILSTPVRIVVSCEHHHTGAFSQYLLNSLGLVGLEVKVTALPQLPRLLYAVAKLSKIKAALVVVVAQVVIPV